MKNKGFTLIEVLAVIVILGVIIVIAIPEISHFITKSKMNALKVSADGIVRAAELYRTGNETSDEVVKFTILNGEEIGENKLNYQGKIDSGTIMIYGENEIALCVTSGRYTALKNLDDITINVAEGSCLFNEETQAFETKEYCGDYMDQINDITTAHLEEIFNINKENADKMALIKTDYESQISTQKDAYESQISSLNTELTDLKSLGNALPANILTTKSALVNGMLINGAMANNGGLSSTLNAGQVFNIPAGYTTGGTITANSLVSQTSDATALATDIAPGKTAYVNGSKITGTMVVDVSANLITKTRDFSFSSSTTGQENLYVTTSTLTFDFPTKIVGIVSIDTIARSNAWVYPTGGVVTGVNTATASASYPRSMASSGTFRVTAIGY